METFSEFKARKLKESPKLRGTTDAYLRGIYEMEGGKSVSNTANGSSSNDEPQLLDNSFERRSEMTVGRALFDFEGRLSRRDYWLKGFLIFLPISIIINIIYFLEVGNELVQVTAMLISIVSIWPGLALIVKRLHDHDRSGWLALTPFIPILGIPMFFWVIVKVWFLRGTVGANRFGYDPVQELAETTTAS